MTDLEKQLEAEIQQLDHERIPFDSLWQECAELVQPHKQVTKKNTSHPGREDIEQTLEITAQQSNQTLASGQMSHIVPMGQRWFALAPPPRLLDDPAALRYYASTTEAIHNALASSNFYGEIHEQFLDRGCFGTSALHTRPGRNNQGLHFETFRPGSFSIAEDDFATVAYLARTYSLTAAQAAATFEGDTLPEPIQKALSTTPFQKFDFCHYIRPNPKHQRGNILSFAYNSYHIFRGDKTHLIRQAGYHEMPAHVSRWLKWGDSPYGISPTMFALPPSRQANYLESLGDLLGELSAFPRSLVPSSLKGEIDYRPNGITIFDTSLGAAEMPREWLTQGRYDVLQDRLNHKIDQIRATFHVPLFELVSQREKQMTAYEVQQRVNEKSSLFHPIFVRAVVELLTPVILRAYSILATQPGALPMPPPSVIRSGEGPFIPDPEVSFVSPLALALHQNQFSALPSVLELIGHAAQFDPSAIDSFNAAALLPELVRAHNLPQHLIRTPEEIAARKQAAADAAAAAQAEQLAGGIQKLGGAKGLQELANVAPQP